MPNTPQRPSEKSMDIKEAACLEILPEVMTWLDASFSEEDVLKDLAYAADDDAYKFAKNLDRKSWDSDYDLVEILSGYSTYGPYKKAVEAWVRENNILTPFQAGDKVMTRHGEGTVVARRPETAEITVQPVVPDGTNYGETGGWVIRVENATKTS